MRYVSVLLLFCGLAYGQIDPEAQQLYTNAALHAFQILPQLDLKATIKLDTDPNLRPTTTEVSIVELKPSRALVSVKSTIGTSTQIVADGVIWVEDTHSHQYASRAGELRRDSFVTTLESGGIVPIDRPLLRAEMMGEEALTIEGKTFECRRISVTYQMPAMDFTATEVLWVEKQYGVLLKRQITDNFPHPTRKTIEVTRFRTDITPAPETFAREPVSDSLENADFASKHLTAILRGPADFSFATSNGKPFTPLDLEGQPGVLVFTAPDCKACADEVSELAAASEKLKAGWGKAFQVVVENPAGGPAAAGRVIYATSEQLERLGIEILPATMSIGPDGRLRDDQEGFITADQIVQLVQKAAVPPAAPKDAGYVFAGQTGVVAPVPVSKPSPVLTSQERSLKVFGEVALHVVVAKDGTVQSAAVQRSLQPDLDARAMETVQKWFFKPGTRDGVPANVAITVVINFPPR